jgi:hypothetical protein
VAQAMRIRFAWPVVVVAAVIALVGASWPHRAGMLLAVIGGVVVPLALESWSRARVTSRS